MKILLAFDSFKGSYSATEISDIIEQEIKEILPSAELRKIALADGGSGTVVSLVRHLGGKIIYCNVRGPLVKRVNAFYGILNDNTTAVIEMAAAAGYHLVPEHNKNPLTTTTYGVGELINHALSQGCKKIILGLGDSATIDAGTGLLQALGIKFYDKNNNKLGYGGIELLKLAKIDTSRINNKLHSTKFIIAHDVDNYLTGEQGAAYVFGPQKGASREDIILLDKALKIFANFISQHYNREIDRIKGAGSAGGTGAGLYAFFDAQWQKGTQLIFNYLNFEQYLSWADLIITGEGRIDSQTIMGKVPYGVAQIAKKFNKPVWAIAGKIGNNAHIVFKYGINEIFSLSNLKEFKNKISLFKDRY